MAQLKEGSVIKKPTGDEVIATVNDVPSKVSELENDSGYLTNADLEDAGSGISQYQDVFTSTGQTRFTLSGTYLPNSNSLNWYLDGIKQSNAPLVEVNNNTVDIKGGTPIGATILFEYITFSNISSVVAGIQGEQGIQGPKGEDGYTPQKGIDYFDGDKGDNGDFSDMTATHVQTALGYKPMSETGGTFTGTAKAQNNNSYTTAQLRNVILSSGDANLSSMQDGDIWIKYE